MEEYTSITADIELKPEAKKKCHNCVFIPIAPQISQQIDDILDSMVKADILQYTNEATNIVSNLLNSF